MAVFLVATSLVASAQQTLVSFGSGSFSVDPGAVTAAYKQSGQGISFGPGISLGDSIGGRISPIRLPGGSSSLGLIMRLNGANPDLPFSLEAFDANFNVTAKFQGQTSDLVGATSFVPLKLVEGSVQASSIAGLQFTWDGGGAVNVELLSIATTTSPASPPSSAPEPSPSPTPALQSPSPPAPAPSPSPAPKPSPGLSPKPISDRARPTLKIISPATVRGSHYTMTVNLSDNVRPVRVQYRLRAPSAKDFGKWIPVNLRNKAKTQNWSSPHLTLNRLGVWQVQVQAFDAAKNASLVPTLRVNRTH